MSCGRSSRSHNEQRSIGFRAGTRARLGIEHAIHGVKRRNEMGIAEVRIVTSYAALVFEFREEMSVLDEIV